MIEIKKIHKKDIPSLMDDDVFWNHSFLSISKHRLLAHFKNPNSDDDDVVLLLAYSNSELLGYMGVFIDRITISGQDTKIGWLSTWWVHPKTKGSGIGREILNAMYTAQGGKIGISQFTPSAKRVYDKSGYFTVLKENDGVKAVLRSNLSFVIPMLYPKSAPFKALFNGIDSVLNFFINGKLAIQSAWIKSDLKGITLEYLQVPDKESMQLIEKHGKKDLSPKTMEFFEWMKAYPWVQDAPLLELTNTKEYEFSMYDKSFAIYYIKIVSEGIPVGFIVLQRRNHVAKLLFSYYDKEKYADIVANIIKLQCITQDVREIICYDSAVTQNLKRSAVFLYRTKKLKQSIISKEFGKDDFTDTNMNFGDGDCSFA